MRDVFISNCEKCFLQKLVSGGYRLDGRSFNESRKLDIRIGSEYGSCMVTLGETRVLAQVSCEVVQPKQIRPNEGILYINVELGPMAAPQFEANRQTDLSVYLNRLLEKCYKDSKCIDLESLCIVVEEKVWSLRVDLKVLNHDGNLVECSSVAALTALAHFRRPDTTRQGDAVTVHSLQERDPIPTVLYHYPICFTYAIFDDVLLTDPTQLEESVCVCGDSAGVGAGGEGRAGGGGGGGGGGLLVVGANQYRELCLLQLGGGAAGSAACVRRAARSACDRAKDLVDTVKRVVAADDALRQKRVKINFGDVIADDHILSLSRRELSVRLQAFAAGGRAGGGGGEDAADDHVTDEPTTSKYDVVQKERVAELVSAANSKWVEVESDSDD